MPGRTIGNPLRGAARLILIVLATVAYAICLAAARTIRLQNIPESRLSALWIHRWSRAVCLIAGIRVQVSGTVPSSGSLITPNHTGYMDIIALAAAAPCLFAPKAEVAQWPLIGLLLRWVGLPFVERRASRGLQAAGRHIECLLRDRQSVCVFLEGTSTGGEWILPFRPSLLQAAIESEAPVAPAAIAWQSDQPGVEASEHLAYWKDHVFFPHLCRFLGIRRVSAQIAFAKSITAEVSQDRKFLADIARNEALRLLVDRQTCTVRNIAKSLAAK
jgi:1-acyl-sn-glycerol-3-phosphate acyltransferase